MSSWSKLSPLLLKFMTRKKSFSKKGGARDGIKAFYCDNDLEELHFLFASFVLFKVDKIQFWTSFIKDRFHRVKLYHCTKMRLFELFSNAVSEAHVQFLAWSTPPINIDDNGLISMQIMSHSITCLGKSKVFITRNKIYCTLFKNAFLTCPRPTFLIFLHWLVGLMT